MMERRGGKKTTTSGHGMEKKEREKKGKRGTQIYVYSTAHI